MDNEPSSFDIRGLLFFVKFTIGIAVLMTAAHFGSLYAARTIDVSQIENYENIKAETDSKISAILETRAAKKTIASDTWSTREIKAFDLNSHIPSTGKAIAADLGEMKVTLYDDGKEVNEYPIISKGQDGSRWQTPVGAYSIETKEKTHLSSIGDVYMPYSMEFYGNFFIHGWPTYPNGTPVRLGYTGGCIRLFTSDAKVIFAFADIGTPIFVYQSTTSEPTLHNAVAADSMPQVSADAYLVANVETGEVFAEKNASKVRPLASLTKLITSVVANEAITYDKQIKITQHVMDTFGEKTLKLGDILTATELQYPLLMQSDNGAAVALADAFGESGFIKLMNAKASAIGMDSTHFEDPHGISEYNVTTAEDLFRLSEYLYSNEKYLLNITKLPQKTIPATAYNSEYNLNNFNVFSAMPEFIGGKTGQTTAAKQTMVALFSYTDPDDKTSTSTLAVIVLGSDDRKQDVTELYNWTLASLDKSPTMAVSK